MLSYYLLAPILKLIGMLPSRVLYRLADFVAFVLRDVIGYRKKVVEENLRNSFPEKTEAERRAIARESYTHLADRVVENLKCISISKAEVQERVTVRNIEMTYEWYEQGRNVVILVGHIGSWELGGYKASLILKHKTYAVVSLLSNPRFNAMIQRTRGKMGMVLIGMQHAKEFFARKMQGLGAVILISDQSPANPKNGYWTNFLHQDTCFFTGGERYARQHDCAVLFVKIKQTARGYYDFELIKICDSPAELPENGITQKYVELLEQTLHERPADWLWSHKRWKRKRTVEPTL